jgi:hypothetical protein
VKATHYICNGCRRLVRASEAVLFVESDMVLCERCHMEQYRTELAEGMKDGRDTGRL